MPRCVVSEEMRPMEEVRAEMTANVYEIVAAEGDKVARDDVLVMTESMKMEIPVLAPCDGVLAQVLVAVGDAVNEGDLIAVVE